MTQRADQIDQTGLSFKELLAESRRTMASPLRRRAFVGVAGAAQAPLAARAILKGRRPRVEIVEGADEARRLTQSHPSRVVLSLPRHLFMVKSIVLPGVDPRELASMLEFEITDLFPIEADRLTWDSYPIGVTAEGYTRLRVMGIETTILEQQIDRADLPASILSCEPSTVTLANAYLSREGQWPTEPVAVVAASSETLDVAVLGAGGLEFDRGLSLARGAFSASTVAAQTAATLAMYSEGAKGPVPSRVELVCTEGSEELAREIRAATGLAVEMFPAPSFIDEVDSFDVETCTAVAAAVGGFLDGAVRVSFLPQALVRKRSACRRAQALLFTALLVGLFAGLAWGALFARGRRMAHNVSELKAKVARIAPEANQIDAKKQRLAAVKRQLSGRDRVLEVILELYSSNITPPDISLTSMKLDEKGLLTLRGHVQEMYRASEYAQILERSDVFGRAAQQGVASFQRTEGGKTFISFTILRNLSEEK